MSNGNTENTELARRTAGPLFKIPAHAMAAAQFAAPEALGVPSMPFYILARGSALGPVGPEVITAAFVWFEPGFVAEAYATATTTLTALAAEDFWRAQMYKWAEQTLHDDLQLSRLAELLTVVVDTASSAQAPLFAGWRAHRPPESPASSVLHQLYALRELRNALHAGAILSAGLTPLEAVTIRTPWIAQMYGWPTPSESTAPTTRWIEAEEATNVGMGRVFDVLTPTEGNELADLLDAVLRRTGALWTDDSASPATSPVPVAGVQS